MATWLVVALLGMAPAVQAGPPGGTPPPQVALVTADTAFANVGRAVAIDGDTALVSSPFANVGATDGAGAVYVFVREGDAWVQQAELSAEPAEAFSNYGSAVAIDGDTAVVGANGAAGFNGAVYVYTRSGGTWTQQARLVASDGESFSDFGLALDLDGDSLVVGAPSMFIGGENVVGAAYVFVRNLGSWSQQQKLIASDGGAFDSFGNAVAIEGERIVIAAHQADLGSVLFAGAAYAFERSGGVWSQTQKLSAADAASEDTFGSSIALSGDRLVLGARQVGVLGEGGNGTAYVFTHEGGSWQQQAKLLAADGALGDEFGTGVGIDGDTVVVSAPFNGAQAGVNLEAGAVYVYAHAGGSWTQQARIRAIEGRQGEHMGNRIGLSGATAIVGAQEATVGDNAFQGKAYVFALGLPQLSVAPLAMTFGEVPVGSSPTERTLTVRNLGTADLFSGALVLIGADAAQFAIASDGCSGQRLQPADACSARVAFAPAAIGSFTAQVVAPGSAGVAFVDATGEGVAPLPQIAVSPDPVLQSLPQGERATQTLTVMHAGDSQTLQWLLQESSLPRTGRSGVVTPATVVPGAIPAPDIALSRFRPMRGSGAARAHTPQPAGLPPVGRTLTHSASDTIVPENSAVCTDNDTGTSNANQFLRTFTLTDFGIDGEFEVSSVQFALEGLTVAAPVTVNLYTLEGETLSYFDLALIATTSVSLQPQTATLIDVPLSAQVAPGSTLVLEVAVPDLGPSGGRFSPGSNTDGQTAPSYLASSACGADDPVDTASIGFPDMHLVMSVTGTTAAAAPECALPAWLDVDVRSGALAPGQAQTLQLDFDADTLAVGDVSANLCFVSNAEDALRVVPVTLTVTPGVPQLEVNVPALEFGSVVVGAESDAKTVVVSNHGAVPVQLGSVQIPGGAPFHVVADGCAASTLAPDASCSINVVFAPDSTGPQQGTLQIASDAPDSPATVTLSGLGLPAGVAIFGDGFE